MGRARLTSLLEEKTVGEKSGRDGCVGSGEREESRGREEESRSLKVGRWSGRISLGRGRIRA